MLYVRWTACHAARPRAPCSASMFHPWTLFLSLTKNIVHKEKNLNCEICTDHTNQTWCRSGCLPGCQPDFEKKLTQNHSPQVSNNGEDELEEKCLDHIEMSRSRK